MNCPNCGHPTSEHYLTIHGCKHAECDCRNNKETVELLALRTQRDELLEALKRIADPKNWVKNNGELLWNDFYGNEFNTEHAIEIARAAIAKVEAENV